MFNAIRKLLAPTIAGPSIDQALEYFYWQDTGGGSHVRAEKIKRYESGIFLELVRIDFINSAGNQSMDVWLEPCLNSAPYGEW